MYVLLRSRASTVLESLHFQRNLRQRFHLLLIFTNSTQEMRRPHTQETSFGMPPSQAKDKDGTHYNQITSGDFKTPLTTVTTVENLPIGNTAAPKRILSSKLEVNPNKTDKTDADIKDKCFDLFDWLRSDQVLEENYFDEKEYSVKSNCSANTQVSVKGRLKTHLDYWGNVIGANGVVTSVIKEGCKIPFTYTQKAYF